MLKRTEPLKTGWKKNSANSVSKGKKEKKKKKKKTVKMSRLCKAGLFFFR